MAKGRMKRTARRGAVKKISSRGVAVKNNDLALQPDPTLGSAITGLTGPVGGDKVLEATASDWLNARALVDPSQLIAGRYFYPYNPSVLVTRKGLSIYDQMKLDEQIKVCLSFVKNTVLAAGWEVVSPGDQEKDWEVTEFVRNQFTHMPGGADQAIRKILFAIDYGYSVTEKVYGDVEWAPGMKAITDFISIKPHYIDLQQDRHGKVLALLQRYAPGQGSGLSVPGQQTAMGLPGMPPAKFVLYTHDIEFENHYGKSALEAAYRAWWTKDNAYKWLAIMLERFGMPPLFLFYDPNKIQGPDLTRLKSVVKSIQNATMGLLPRPNKDTLEFWTTQLASQSKDVFISSISHFDADISKALLMPSLIGATGDEQLGGGKGSYARANVHFKNFLNVVRAMQRSLCDRAINPQLVKQVCDMNFSGLKSYPEFKFLDPDDETETAIFELWAKLVDGQVVNRIADDEQHIRKGLGFPANDDPTIEPLRPKAAPGAGGAGGAVPGGPEPGMGGAEPADGPQAIPDAKLSDEMRAFAADNDGVWIDVAGHPMCFRRSALRMAA